MMSGDDPLHSMHASDADLERSLAIDCEMVLVQGGRSALARCCVVNYLEEVMLDLYAAPPAPVVEPPAAPAAPAAAPPALVVAPAPLPALAVAPLPPAPAPAAPARSAQWAPAI